MEDQGPTEPKPREYRDPGPAADAIARQVIAAAIAVHRELGPGHLERIYERALAVEFSHRGIAFQTQVPADVHYRGVLVGEGRIDLLVEEWVVVELKAVETLTTNHTLQALWYLKVTELPLALLINFNVPLLLQGVRRVVPALD
ncbi:MAG: GxxExxY protein [Myxococcales bacterium]|nr:GxxExxY protein [Myxococcales bacterium]